MHPIPNRPIPDGRRLPSALDLRRAHVCTRLWITLLAAVVVLGIPLAGQNAATTPTARLVPAPTIAFPSQADSNSPAVWQLVDGRLQLFVFTSVAGVPSRHIGTTLANVRAFDVPRFDPHPGHGVWMEAIVPDVDGAWYGYYHREAPAEVCNDTARTIPQIGAARSFDHGATWQDLGIVLEAPPLSYDCASTNRYFVGGVGDFSVQLDHDSRYLYFFFSQYARRESSQGVSVARMAWADRDAPAGRVAVWLRSSVWLPARRFGSDENRHYSYPGGSPIYPVSDGWHDDDRVEAFWGPSVHWNSYLEQYVMLINRARDAAWTQEGVYVAFSPTLDDPARWSTPQRLIANGRWYPQVIGLETGTGTDRQASDRARFYMGGRSEYFIQFTR